MYQSEHAARRVQQRAIPPLVIDLLFQFGASEATGEGTIKLYFDKPARRKVKAYVGPLAGFLEPHLDVYVMVSGDSKLITAAHRYERIRRH